MDQFYPKAGQEFSDLRGLLEHLAMAAEKDNFGTKHGPAFATRMRLAHAIISKECEILYQSIDAMQHAGIDSENAKRAMYALLLAALNIGGAYTISEVAIAHLNQNAPRKARTKKAAEDDARIDVQKRIIAEFIQGRNSSAPTAFVREHLNGLNAIAGKLYVDGGEYGSETGGTYTASVNTWIARLKAVLNETTENQD